MSGLLTDPLVPTPTTPEDLWKASSMLIRVRRNVTPLLTPSKARVCPIELQEFQVF